MRMQCLTAIIVTILMLISAQAAGKDKNVYRASINEQGVQVIDVIGGEYFFDPDHIIVKKDVPVELIIIKEPGIVYRIIS